jgi:ferredoxin
LGSRRVCAVRQVRHGLPPRVIRAKVYDPGPGGCPRRLQDTGPKDKAWSDLQFTIQVAAEDCTGCSLCVAVCPAKNKAQPRLKAINMAPQLPRRRAGAGELGLLPEFAQPRSRQLNLHKISHQQMQEPLFEFSGACAGCGETPYIKLATQLFGDRMLIANATGCSSIYGGNLPTTPYTHNDEGRGPAWSNSLFEDNAEFGLGFRVSVDKQSEQAGNCCNPWPLMNGAPSSIPATWPPILSQRADRRGRHLRAAGSGWRRSRAIQSWLADLAGGGMAPQRLRDRLHQPPIPRRLSG